MGSVHGPPYLSSSRQDPCGRPRGRAGQGPGQQAGHLSLARETEAGSPGETGSVSAEWQLCPCGTLQGGGSSQRTARLLHLWLLGLRCILGPEGQQKALITSQTSWPYRFRRGWETNPPWDTGPHPPRLPAAGQLTLAPRVLTLSQPGVPPPNSGQRTGCVSTTSGACAGIRVQNHFIRPRAATLRPLGKVTLAESSPSLSCCFCTAAVVYPVAGTAWQSPEVSSNYRGPCHPLYLCPGGTAR